MFFRITLCLLAFMASISSAQAADSFRFDVKESMLQDIIDQIPMPSVSGSATVRMPDYPCPVPWDLRRSCAGPMIISGGWSASVEVTDVEIEPDGIHLTVEAEASFGPYSASHAVDVVVDVSLSNNTLSFEVGLTSFPIGFTFPGIGYKTVATPSVLLPLNVDLPIGVPLFVTDSAGGAVAGRLSRLDLDLLDGTIRIRGHIQNF